MPLTSLFLNLIAFCIRAALRRLQVDFCHCPYSFRKIKNAYYQTYLFTITNYLQVCFETLHVRKIGVTISKSNIVWVKLSILLVHQPENAIATQELCHHVPIHRQINFRGEQYTIRADLCFGDKLARNSRKTLNPTSGHAGQ